MTSHTEIAPCNKNKKKKIAEHKSNGVIEITELVDMTYKQNVNDINIKKQWIKKRVEMWK